MSTDSIRYEARCQACGRLGEYIDGSDDWGRTWERWLGFQELPEDDYRVARQRTGLVRPVCECGSLNITRGERLKSS